MNRFGKLKEIWTQKMLGKPSVGSGGLCRLACLLMGLAMLGSTLPVQAQSGTVLFRDDFTSPLNTNNWGYYDNTYSIHRTQFGNVPEVDTTNGYMRLHLDSYNSDPTYGSTFLKGTEMYSKTRFPIGAGGVEFEARVRGTNIPAGTLGAFFTFGDKGVYPDSYLWDEVDYEILGNYPSNQLWLNIWDDYSPVNGGPHLDSHPVIAGLNWKNWTDYKVRAYPYVTQFYVNDVLVRSSYDIVPADPMALRFNIWAPNDSWTAAYNSAITTTSQANNKDYYFDVDYVQVRALTPGVTGDGTGLSASYYNSENLTGTPVTRVDPQVNFDWGNGSPATGINSDGFSARWTGQVLAPFTETYTFTTNSDDGVRLFVNGQQLVNNWTNHGPTENSGTISLTAGAKYDIRMEYYDHAFGAVAQLFWSSPSLPRRAIPQSQLYPTAGATPSPPTIAITTPASGSTVTSLPAISGTVGGTNLSRVDLYLYRGSDAKWWTGTTWGTAETPFAATLSNGSWTRNSGLPVASSTDASKSLTSGRYTIYAWAYDSAGQAKNASSQLTVNIATPTPPPPTIAITTPASGSTVTSLPAISGTATGTNLQRVDLYLYRGSDAKWWTGTAWGTTETAFAATLANGSWTRNSGLPVASSSDASKSLTNGSYALYSWVYDGAGQAKNASSQLTVNIATPTPTPVPTPTPGPSQAWQAADLAVGSDNLSRLLWVRPDNAFSIWSLSASNAVTSTPTAGPIAGWSASGIGVGGDLKVRALLNSTGGQAEIRPLQNIATGAYSSPGAYGPYAGFVCRDIATASDNTTRLMWARSDGAFTVWTVNTAGGFINTPLLGPISGWSPVSLSVGGDGKTRVLLDNVNGQAAVWTLQDGTSGNLTSTPALGPISGFICRDMAMGSDNIPRLLWARSDEAFVVWTVPVASSSNVTSTPLYGPIAGWSARKVGVGGDLKTRLLLGSTDGRAVVWTLDSSGAYTSTPIYGPVATGAAQAPVASRSKAPAVAFGGAGPRPENPSSSVALSSAAANVATGTVTLGFTGQLDAGTATDASRYTVSVSGEPVGVVKATLSAAGTVVTLSLPAGAFNAGDEVKVGYKLLDAKGYSLSGNASIKGH